MPVALARGRKRAGPIREIINAIFYVLRGGIAWRLLPDSFPPWRTVYRWFARLRDDGVFESLNHLLAMLDREHVGRHPSPSAAVIDSHAMVGTDGRALTVQAHAASIQGRDGAGPLPRASRSRWPFVKLGYADAGYAGQRVTAASPIRIEIVRKLEGQVGFAVHARRWVVERFFTWIGRNRLPGIAEELSARGLPTERGEGAR